MQKIINTIIVGAGQSGLSLSYELSLRGIDHLVFEKGKIADEWRNRRWDNFHLITPNYITSLPGFSYKGKDPKGFDNRDQVIAFFNAYVKKYNLPVLEDIKVLSIQKEKSGFRVETTSGIYKPKNIVVAIGSFHKPLIPEISKSLPSTIKQIHSSEYKNADKLSKAGVLVVGGGNSGIQIAVDLNKSGRKAYLSLGRVRIVPRNYRGKDFMEWAKLLGILDRKTNETSEEIKNTPPPILFGYGETVNIRKISKDGVKLLGRLKEVKKGRFVFDDNVSESIEKGEAALEGFKATVDKYITEKKLKLPKEEIKQSLPMPESFKELNLKDISVIIWATGFQDDWGFLKIPVFDGYHQPIHQKGVSTIPGLYFIGLRWLSKYKSFLLCGIKEDAKYLASKIN